MRRAATQVLFVIAAIALVRPTPAHAQDDYESASDAWNGLSTLAGLARGHGLDVLQVSRIDWDELNESDVVFMLYPTANIEPNNLAAFIRNGGHVLFADDFGRGDDAIERLSMLRSHGVGVDARFHDNLDFAPVAKAVAKNHELAKGVNGITCNHPAVLTSVKGPEVVFGFGSDEAVVVAGALGVGRFVVLSDPSVLINRMLEFDGNLQFAINLIRFLAKKKQGRLVLLVGDFSVSGTPSDRLQENEGALGLSKVNRWLEELNDYFLTEASLKVIGILIALLVAGLAASSLPLRNRLLSREVWTRARPDALPPRHFHTVVDQFDVAGKRENWALPAAVLRDNLVRTLAQLTGLRHPLKDELPLYEQLTARVGPEPAQLLRSHYGQLRDLPTRAQAASTWNPPHFSQRDFERLSLGMEALYRTLPSEAYD